MSCGSCGSGGCSSQGCGRNGGCATGGCNKLNSYDWLNNMLAPDQTEVDNIYEVRFKNTRKAFYRNVNGLRLFIGDWVVVESDRGYDVGVLALGGMMAELQMKKKGYRKQLEDIPRIYRKANEKDIELLEQVREKEQATLIRSREIVWELNLDMKLSDVEFQGDNAKAIFYYIADHRVDFRELIKLLAREFRVRVEMKQIGLRHEAGLVGGIGSCGRELCCSTWLTEFKTVSTSAARFQNLSLNPMKISGLCGRLKCCLNFELESYLDALEDFPKIERIETTKGKAFLQKTDIFKRKMWFSFANESTWYPLDVDEVKDIYSRNKNGEIPEVTFVTTPLSNSEFEDGADGIGQGNLDFVDVVGTEVPTQEPPNRRRRGNRKNNRRGGGKGGEKRTSENTRQSNPPAQEKGKSRRGGSNRNRNRQKDTAQKENAQKGNAPKSNKSQQPTAKKTEGGDNKKSRPTNNRRGGKGRPGNRRGGKGRNNRNQSSETSSKNSSKPPASS